jgi:hydroxymethylbilane synthase
MMIKIGTRGSKLALIQTDLVREQLSAIGIESEIVVIKTSGDKITDKPLYDIGGKALFVKELEEALIEGSIDIAVHSMKDVPAFIPDALIISACLKREDISDVLISRNASNIESLPIGAKVGTCAVRRIAQLKKLRPDLNILPLRGNVETRLQKLDSENFDAIILAAAGLKRLGIWEDYFHIIDPLVMMPAVGQGAVGIQARKDDITILDILSKINHKQTFDYLQIERGFVEEIEGSCRTPLGCYSRIGDGKIYATFMLAKDDLSNISQVEYVYDAGDKGKFYEYGRSAGMRLRANLM